MTFNIHLHRRKRFKVRFNLHRMFNAVLEMSHAHFGYNRKSFIHN